MGIPAVLFFEANYYQFKKEYVETQFDVTDYVTLSEELVGQTIRGKTVEGLSEDLVNRTFHTVVLALPLCPELKRLIRILLQMGVNPKDVHILLDKPTPLGNESICRYRNDVNFQIDHGGEVVCHIGEYRFLVDTDNELFILNEIFALGEYHFHLPDKDVVLIDVGMNIGVASLYFSRFANVKRIYAYEPFPATYQRALENIALNGKPTNLITHNYGLSNANKDLELDYNENRKGLMSTTRSNSINQEDASSRIRVTLCDVFEAFSSILLENPHSVFAFKIDCEGGEYDILKRLHETGLLRRIRLIHMEWHNFDDKNASVLLPLLQESGFFLHTDIHPNSLASSGNILAFHPNPTS